MRFNKSKREEFRKSLKILIPQMEKSEIVNHFQKEGYPRRTIYDTINRMQFGGTINDKKKTDRPTSWTPARKNQLERLINNRKGVSQRRLGHKLGVSRMTMCRQLSKMNISCYKREKTPKYSEKQAEKAKYLEMLLDFGRWKIFYL